MQDTCPPVKVGHVPFLVLQTTHPFSGVVPVNVPSLNTLGLTDCSSLADWNSQGSSLVLQSPAANTSQETGSNRL